MAVNYHSILTLEKVGLNAHVLFMPSSNISMLVQGGQLYSATPKSKYSLAIFI